MAMVIILPLLLQQKNKALEESGQKARGVAAAILRIRNDWLLFFVLFLFQQSREKRLFAHMYIFTYLFLSVYLCPNLLANIKSSHVFISFSGIEFLWDFSIGVGCCREGSQREGVEGSAILGFDFWVFFFFSSFGLLSGAHFVVLPLSLFVVVHLCSSLLNWCY